jgi:hypothetical protein
MTSVVKDVELFREMAFSTVGETFEVDGQELKILQNEQTGSGRWDSHHSLVWKEGETLYSCDYRLGLTEYQENSWEDFSPRDIYEVVEREVTITEYVKKA